MVGYRERHHVVPRCVGGGNESENLVELTAEEHYVAHQLLVKMHPGVRGLTFAAVRMAKQCTGNKAYGWLRRRYVAASRELHVGKPLSAEHRAKLSAALKGKTQPPRSAGHRAKIAVAMQGNRHGLGQVHSPKARAKMSMAALGNQHNRGKICSAEHRANVSAAKRGKPGKPNSPEARAKISAALMGNRNWAGRDEGVTA